MSGRLAYRDFEAQEAFVVECRRRIDAWRVPSELRLVQTGLGPTTVLVAGGPSASNGRSRPVLVLPGTNLAAAALLPLAAHLARTRQVLVVDLPGQPGLSYPKRPSHFGAYGGWLDEVVTSLDRRPTVVAHALGAAVALLATPEHVVDLLLVNPAGIVKPRRTAALTIAELRWRVRPSATTARAFLQRLGAPAARPRDETVQWLALVGTHAHPALTPSPVGDDVLARWSGRADDVRILAGAVDPRFPPDRLATIAGTHGLATTVVQGAGHLIPDERPEAIAAALR
ncbi:MAG TPA: alpha/beta fold hydrolase [Acidimicrobiales bacterium]|nr:alpha/beta fold hydrolase [Acidimicrobiales bacterium]